MMQVLLPVLSGAALGAALAVPVRLISAFLLRQRGLAPEMEQNHFVILLASLVLTGGAIGWRAGFSFHGLYLVFVMVISACAFYIDAKHRVIPNELVLAILLLTALFGFTGAIPFRIWSSLLGFAACFVIFFLPSLFGKNIGAGDVKLAAAMGFALGLTGSLYAVVCMGLLVLAYVLLDKRMPLPQRLKEMIPMGPFLALALVVVLLVPQA
ncbi:MAG: A24 family peptidase [Christensenella sp.]|nr:A24 family peptidase [Christensenella sp.]